MWQGWSSSKELLDEGLPEQSVYLKQVRERNQGFVSLYSHLRTGCVDPIHGASRYHIVFGCGLSLTILQVGR